MARNRATPVVDSEVSSGSMVKPEATASRPPTISTGLRP
ncbi:hypothetical protein PSPL106493_04670 [Pseudomonas plecoglossicida]